jgi:putative GTP pyrophosphokinase
MEHDIQYKSVAPIPASIRRRFMSLAGMLEIADREFEAIQE